MLYLLTMQCIDQTKLKGLQEEAQDPPQHREGRGPRPQQQRPGDGGLRPAVPGPAARPRPPLPPGARGAAAEAALLRDGGGRGGGGQGDIPHLRDGGGLAADTPHPLAHAQGHHQVGQHFDT